MSNGATYNELSFRDPNRIREFFSPNWHLAREAGRKLKLTPATRRRKAGDSRLLILIDEEWDFGDTGRLPVIGTFDDVERLIKRIEAGVMGEKYTDIILTIDEHPPVSIHSDAWWLDDQGNPPDVSVPLMMNLTDPNDQFPFIGRWVDGRPEKPFRPALMKDWTVNKYAPHLLATGQGPIWVFADHCRAATDGVAIIPALAECIEWACAALSIQPIYMRKGHIAETDWFGPFRPCMDIPNHPQGGLQTQYLDMIRAASRTEITGEAADFCVKSGMIQVLDYYGNPADRSVLERVSFITDCTSPIVPDSPGNTANADFRAGMAAKGVNMITSDSPFI